MLRELARRRIGERVSRGRKRGFGIPVQRWLAGRWRGLAEDLLTDPLLAQQGWIREGPALTALRDSVRSGSVSKQLWYICVLESWLRHERRGPSGLSAADQAPARARTA